MKKLTILILLVTLVGFSAVGTETVTVPEWAQGVWYVGGTAVRLKIAEITATQYISFLFDIEIMRLDVVSVTDDTVTFAGDLQIRRLSSDTIFMGSAGVWVTLFR